MVPLFYAVTISCNWLINKARIKVCDNGKRYGETEPLFQSDAKRGSIDMKRIFFIPMQIKKRTERKKESERFGNSEMAYYFSIQVRFMAGIWLFLQKHICISLTSTVPSITNETKFAGTKIGTKGIGTVAIDDVTDGWRCAFIGIWNRHTNLRLIAHTVTDSFCVGTKVRGTHRICSSKYLFFRQSFFWLEDLEKIICPLKYCWQIAAMGCLSETSPTPAHWRAEFCPMTTPNWPVMSGHTSSGKLPSKSGCRL